MMSRTNYKNGELPQEVPKFLKDLMLLKTQPDDTMDLLDIIRDEVSKQKKKQEVLEKHKQLYKITYTAGRYQTRLPRKDGGNAKLIRKSNLPELEDMIVAYYEEMEQTKIFADVFNEWILELDEFNEVTDATLTRYYNHFKRFFENNDDEFCRIDVRDITNGVLERFIKRTISRFKLTRKTYGGLVILLRGVLKQAKRDGYTEFSITGFFNDLMLPESIFAKNDFVADEDQIFTDEEVALLLKYFCEKPTPQHRGLYLLFLCGARIGELSTLKPEDVNMETMSITIKRTEVQYDQMGEDGKKHRIVAVQNSPKTANGFREILLPDSCKSILKELMLTNQYKEWLFSRPNGERIRSKAFNDALKKACGKVGIKPRTTHKIRKTYASSLLGSVSDKSLQKQLGHKQISTTQQYYVFNRKAKEERRQELAAALPY